MEYKERKLVVKNIGNRVLYKYVTGLPPVYLLHFATGLTIEGLQQLTT